MYKKKSTNYMVAVAWTIMMMTMSHFVSNAMQARCGVGVTHFAYFSGKPRWERRRSLSYALSGRDTPTRLSRAAVMAVLHRSFERWSAVIPLNFTRAREYASADIKIGFFHGEHGDGEPFDGVLGVLGHAFSPHNGRLHLDAAESWAVDFHDDKSETAVDLESVLTHEIGHVLGLGHSSITDAVMYPKLTPRTKKFRLHADDVRGVQALYGSNSNIPLTDISSAISLAAYFTPLSFFIYYFLMLFPL